VSSVGSEANLQHEQVFFKHGRLKRIRGRLKQDSTATMTWNGISVPHSHLRLEELARAYQLQIWYGEFHPIIVNGFYAMKKIILTSLCIFLPVNFGIGLLLDMYQTDRPLKIIVSLIISTLFYIVPMYILLKRKAK